MTEATVFIDGEAGTTGLGIRERLATLPGIAVVSIDHGRRKDPEARRAMMADADYLYVAARVGDPYPLRNKVGPLDKGIFRKHHDNRGYNVEYKISWDVLGMRPPFGSQHGFAWDVHWSNKYRTTTGVQMLVRRPI